MHRSLLLLRLRKLKPPNSQTQNASKDVEFKDAMAALDPYEQQLLAVFESCCEGVPGALDPRGLTALCEKLQLEDQTPHLLERLLGRPSNASPRKVTFPQFRDALLALLAAGVSSSDDVDASPEREVRPKFVYGKKKYGRRSKPEDDDSGSESEPSSPVSEKESSTKIMAESAKKRKTTSQRRSSSSPSENWLGELSEEEECVRATWEQLAADGRLGHQELKLVCKATGVEGVAADELVEQLFARLGVQPDSKISFEQFLRLFRSGLAPSQDDSEHSTVEHHRNLSFDADSSSKEPLYISLDSFNSGMVTSEQLLEMWEAGGVAGAARLLHDLGLGTAARRPVSLNELAAALDEEAKALADEQSHDRPPNHRLQPESNLLSVLQASVLIYQAEAKCLKSSLEQTLCERNKLKQDLAEANERASLLAQEVDDRHARLEDSYKQQIRALELKQQEEVRGLQAELAGDREQLATLTTGLQLRMDQMQADESKLRAEATTWLKKSELLEKENGQLKELLAESDEAKQHLQKRVDTIPDLQIRLSELEREQAEVQAQQVRPLLQKVERLTLEMTSLRDTNDELTLRLEQLPRASRETEEADLVSPRGSGKRKGRPSDACSEDSSEEETRPQGKQRRKALAQECEETKQLRERVAELERRLAECQERLQPHSPGFPPKLKQVFQVVRAQILDEILGDPDHSDDHPLLQEISRLQTRCQDLTQLQKTMEADFEMQLCDAKELTTLTRASSSLPSSPRNGQGDGRSDSTEGSSSRNVEQLEQECHHLKENLDQVKVEIVRILSDKEACSRENSALKEQICELSTKVEVATQHPSDSFKEEEEDRVAQLEGRVKELEGCLELMQEEYEKCEEYWHRKLDDERRLFELEQEAEGRKFAELEEKIQEMLRQEQNKGRLSPIDERVLLEQQVTDLEAECAHLQDQLLLCRALLSKDTLSTSTQTEAKPKLAALFLSSGTVISSTSDKQIQANLSAVERNPYELISPPEWVKRQYPASGFKGRAPEQSCRVQLSVMQALKERLQQQDVKCRRFETVIAQQQLHLERLLHQHSAEVAGLQAAIQAGQMRLQQQMVICEQQMEKLAQTDMMAREVYLENAMLTKSVERLEKQCIFLSQQAPSSA
ncbi:blastoderm-specific protein 25D isoform X2 [Neocloeon triangulifer]|uniref:blastoderm-specific protein 25D isoform X2 n=1 Tax=Neocloeon triangulifer TaxID=2078957 RepID=UPI00286EEBCD|nr:blastoderm-specific protein 25D isoform X2 [Neocloeon triangulifer]